MINAAQVIPFTVLGCRFLGRRLKTLAPAAALSLGRMVLTLVLAFGAGSILQAWTCVGTRQALLALAHGGMTGSERMPDANPTGDRATQDRGATVVSFTPSVEKSRSPVFLTRAGLPDQSCRSPGRIGCVEVNFIRRRSDQGGAFVALTCVRAETRRGRNVEEPARRHAQPSAREALVGEAPLAAGHPDVRRDGQTQPKSQTE